MNNKNYKYVVFDFDGVVCDSTNECMVTSWNAWERWNNRDSFRASLKDFSNQEINTFKPLRPYVRGAGEYYILMRSINSQDNFIKNQKDFDILRNKWENNINVFKSIFFKERKKLKSLSIDNWINLHEVYNDVIKVMENLNSSNKLLIATLKDEASVNLILQKNGINILPKNILDQSQIKSKMDALNFFVKNKNISKKDLCFIDDNVTHLIEPKKSGYDVFLSCWGNTVEEHKQLAIQENIQILNSIKEG
jgi:phosphoglycolate phosphatase-like HAD superfamily hydrolase